MRIPAHRRGVRDSLRSGEAATIRSARRGLQPRPAAASAAGADARQQEEFFNAFGGGGGRGRRNQGPPIFSSTVWVGSEAYRDLIEDSTDSWLLQFYHGTHNNATWNKKAHTATSHALSLSRSPLSSLTHRLERPMQGVCAALGGLSQQAPSYGPFRPYQHRPQLRISPEVPLLCALQAECLLYGVHRAGDRPRDAG